MLFQKKLNTTTANKTTVDNPGRLRLQTDLTQYNEDKIKGIDIKFPD